MKTMIPPDCLIAFTSRHQSGGGGRGLDACGEMSEVLSLVPQKSYDQTQLWLHR